MNSFQYGACIALLQIFISPAIFLAQAISHSSIIRKNKIGLHSGIEQNLYLDKLTTPLVYKGYGIPLGLSYHKQNDNSQFDLSLTYTGLKEKSKYHPNRILYINPLEYIPEIDISGDTVLHAKIGSARLPHFSLLAAYYRRIRSNKARCLATYVGGSFSSNVCIPESDNVIVFTPIGLNQFNIAFKSSYELHPQLSFSFGISLPVCTWAIRLPYSLSPVEPNKGIYKSAFSNGRVVSWNKYQSLNAFLTIDYLLHKRIALQLNLFSRYLHYSYPKSIRFLQYNFVSGIFFTF